MILIVDSNIVFSALLRDGQARKLLIDSTFTLYAPEVMLKEIRKYKEEIIKRAEFTKDEFEILFNFITEDIEIVEKEKYAHKIHEANQLIVDKGDAPFLALALTIPNNGIWTQNIKHFKQDEVRIWTTSELLKEATN